MTTFPLGLNKIRSVNVDTDINVISNVEAISGKKEVVLGDIIKQTINLNTVPLTETEDRQFQVFLKQIKNYGLIELPLSNLSVFKPINNEISKITTLGSYPTGSNIIGSTATNITAINVGSYIQFDNTVNNTTKVQEYNFTVGTGTNQGGNIRLTRGDGSILNIFFGGAIQAAGQFANVLRLRTDEFKSVEELNNVITVSFTEIAGDASLELTLPTNDTDQSLVPGTITTPFTTRSVPSKLHQVTNIISTPDQKTFSNIVSTIESLTSTSITFEDDQSSNLSVNDTIATDNLGSNSITIITLTTTDGKTTITTTDSLANYVAATGTPLVGGSDIFLQTEQNTRDLIISPGLDKGVSNNSEINYNNLLGQFRADNGSFNSQSSTLLSNGETTKTYRFRLTEEL